MLEELPPIARSSSFQSHSASSSESSSQQKPGESIPLLHESSYVPSLPSLKDEPSDPFIRVTNVSVFYGENLVLENLSFEMDHNSSPLAVVGPVGSGKVGSLAPHYSLYPTHPVPSSTGVSSVGLPPPPPPPPQQSPA